MGRTWPAWAKSVPKHLTVRWYGDRKHFKKDPLPPWTCRDCGAHFHAIRCEQEVEADGFVQMGPARALQAAWARGLVDKLPDGDT